MAANPRAAAVAALVRQEQDGFSNLILDAELKRQKLEGRDKAFARVWQSWMPRCARSCVLRWHRPAICRCRCRLPSMRRSS